MSIASEVMQSSIRKITSLREASTYIQRREKASSCTPHRGMHLTSLAKSSTVRMKNYQ